MNFWAKRQLLKQMKTNQKDRILDYIRKFGSITSWEAYQDLGVMQLGDRIDQLQKKDINSRQNGNKKRIDMEKM